MAMFYHIETEERTAGGKTGTVYTLTHGSGALAEIWPAHGFNCLRWRVDTADGPRDLLYAAPEWETQPGADGAAAFPFCFPFPNRIRDGKFSFGWKDYQLPLNDSTKTNAIHGFAPRHAWQRVRLQPRKRFGLDSWRFSGVDRCPGNSRFLAGRFYPFGDLSVHRTIAAAGSPRRTTSAKARCRSASAFTPISAFPARTTTIERCKLLAPARSIWDSVDSLPTGDRQPDYRRSQLEHGPPDSATSARYALYRLGRDRRASRRHVAAGGARACGVSRRAASLDERAIFGNRCCSRRRIGRAVCIEPYTCATDAVNLAERKIDAGWKVLQPGEDVGRRLSNSAGSAASDV